nr:hypothetical protein DM860_001644 [Ipomoea trifida]
MDGSAQPPTVNFNCKQGGISRAQFNLVPGQKHSFEATLNGVYACAVFWGRLFGSVEGFNPARDKGQNTVNWKVDKQGLSDESSPQNPPKSQPKEEKKMAAIVGHILILVMAMALSTPSCFAGSPVVNFMDEMDGSVPPPTMNFNCKQGEIPRAQFDLVAGQKHSFEVTRDGVFDCDVVWGKFFCSVEGFNPARDKGQNSVNWKAENRGLSLSYDLKNWEWVAPWKTD